MSLTAAQLKALIDAAGYNRQALRVTPDLYGELIQFQPEEPPFGRPLNLAPSVPVGPQVIVVTDGSENVKMIEGVWTFLTDLRGRSAPAASGGTGGEV